MNQLADIRATPDWTPLGLATLGDVTIPQDALTPELDALGPVPAPEPDPELTLF